MGSHVLRRGRILALVTLLAGSPALPVRAADTAPAFRAGAFAVDITPDKYPVIVNGNFLPASAEKANDKLHARWLVLDDGNGTRIGLCVVDSCLMPRELLDEAKKPLFRIRLVAETLG